MKFVATDDDLTVYPTGLVRDLHKARTLHRAYGWRAGVRHLRYWVPRSWRRRSYWNGFAAESTTYEVAGRGWTPSAACRHLDRKVATLR